MIDVLIDQFTSAGGPLFAALLAVSLLATTITVFKIIQFARLGVGRHAGARAALSRWKAGDLDGGLREAEAHRPALARVAAAGMAAHLGSAGDTAHAREIATQAAVEQLHAMSTHLRVIEAVVQAAPMLGLLGTVIGMIDAFSTMSEGGGAVDPAALAGSIWFALTTTAIGLAIAIPFYFVSVWLEGRVEGERAAMESMIAAILNAPAGRQQAAQRPPPYLAGDGPRTATFGN